MLGRTKCPAPVFWEETVPIFDSEETFVLRSTVMGFSKLKQETGDEMFYSRCFLSLLVFRFNWQTNKTYYLQSSHKHRARGGGGGGGMLPQ